LGHPVGASYMGAVAQCALLTYGVIALHTYSWLMTERNQNETATWRQSAILDIGHSWGGRGQGRIQSIHFYVADGPTGFVSTSFP